MTRIKWFDAIRAFGLILVLVYHLFFELLPGGFLGVDIFFTFSGFLITAIIMGEMQKTGEFRLFRFLKRRAQRIIIPLFLSILFTLPFVLLISPDFTVGIDRQVSSALSFTTNWYNIIAGTSYEAQLLPPLYIHTWSLAVEMQFYIAWGIICTVLAFCAKLLYGRSHQRRYIFFKMSILLLSLVAAVSSFLYMQTLFARGSDLNNIYFNTFTRLFPFYFGAFAAAIWGIQDKQDALLKQGVFSKNKSLLTTISLIVTIGAAALILFNFSQHRFEDDFMYHYGFLFTSLLTVVMIYGTHALHILTPEKVKEPMALRATADMSYDIYLVHWPLYIIFSALIINHVAASLVTLVFTLLLSAIMVYVFERFFIPQNHIGKEPKHKRAALSVLCLIVAALIPISGIVIARAPPISSIEADFVASRTVQDVRNLETIEERVGLISDMPVIFQPLNANLLEPSEGEQSDTVDVAYISDTPTSPTAQDPPTYTVPSDVSDTPESPDTPRPSESPVSPHMESALTSVPAVSGVTLIGDSVPLGAQTTMVNTIPDIYVDAVVARPLKAGVDIVKNMQSRGELGEIVVIALGTNGTNSYASLMTQIIDTLDSGHRLIFVTPFDGRSNDNAKITNATAEWLRDLPSQYDFITIADWNSIAASNANTLAGDRVHMGGQTSMTLYANMVADAINTASQRPAK